MKAIFLVFLFNLFSLGSSRFTLNSNKCEIQPTQDNCLNIWGCMWCNETMTQNATDGSCKIIDICHPPSTNSSCTIVNYDYELECYLSSLTLNILIFCAFWASIFTMLYYTNRLLIVNSITKRVRGTILSLIFILLFFPSLFLYITPTLVFYYWLLSLGFISITYCGIIETYKYKKNNYIRLYNDDGI
jgi:hypothetical protein